MSFKTIFIPAQRLASIRSKARDHEAMDLVAGRFNSITAEYILNRIGTICEIILIRLKMGIHSDPRMPLVNVIFALAGTK
jgi:hypothetical protein